MDINNILSKVDHTYLSPDMSLRDLEILCGDAVNYKVASVCIPPYYVKQAKVFVNDNIKVCTVVGFPNGYNTTNTKVYEAEDSLKNGADEIDMVINITNVKNRKCNLIEEEIKKIRNISKNFILKVIIETSLLSDEEKIRMCQVVTESGADYIKTSTGFSGGGATFYDVELLRKHVGENVKVKASGGISTLEDSIKFINIGADRLGSSKLIKLAKGEMTKGNY